MLRQKRFDMGGFHACGNYDIAECAFSSQCGTLYVAEIRDISKQILLLMNSLKSFNARTLPALPAVIIFERVLEVRA